MLYINDIFQAISDDHTFFLWDDTFYHHQDVTEIGNVLNKEFANVCKWLVDVTLPIHFCEDKTKCILFSKEKNAPDLNLDANLSG